MVSIDDKKIEILNRLLLIPTEEWEWKESKRMRVFYDFEGQMEQEQKNRISSIYINNMDVDVKNFNFMEAHLNGVRIRLILHGGLHIFQIGEVEIANWNGENPFILPFSQRIVLRVTRYVNEQKQIASEKRKQEEELNPAPTMEQI